MNEKAIWEFLLNKIQNPYGVAGLMGNLYVESKFNPKDLQGSYERKLGMSDEQYTAAVDSGEYDNFVHDSAGYGLVQWTHWSRKESLLSYVKEHGKSIGDLNTQLNFMWSELQKYKTVLSTLKSAKSVREASDIVCVRYEKPADQSEKGKQNRANYGTQFYQQFAEKKSSKTVVITTDRTNVRLGNGKEFDRIFLGNKGDSYDWIATAENGWHAIRLSDRVGWISGDFSKVE
jgi:hypothetical protein